MVLWLIWGVTIIPQQTHAQESCTCPCACDPLVIPTTYSSNIKINELLPNPSTDEATTEWLEIKNEENISVDLCGWKVVDASGKTYIFSADDLTTIIPAGGYLVLSRTVSGIALNNSNEEIKLFQPNDNLLQTVTYLDSAQEDYSYARDSENNWQWTNITTPNAENQFITEPNTPLPQEKYSSDIVINEIYANPQTGELEFIELKNKSDADIDLTGWKISDSTDKKYTIKTADFETTKIKKYFVIYSDVSKISLNNDGDTVKLFQPDDNLLEQVSYEKSTKGQSFARNKNDWQWTSDFSPEAENIFAGASPELEYEFSNNIIISELLPDPEGTDSQDEYIEIYNNGTKEVDLLGWSLSDTSRTYTWAENNIINPHEYLILYITETKISLNNSGETITLKDSQAAIVSQASYTQAQTGYSYNWSNNQWAWSTTNTPNQSNIISGNDEVADPIKDQEDFLELSIAEAKEQEKGAKVQIQGVVTVLPSMLGSQYFYIQDDSAGIQIYSSKKDFPADLQIGDLVKVTGETSEAYNEKKINIQNSEDIKIISQESRIEPDEFEEVGEEVEGQLISVTGQIFELSTTKIKLTTDIIIYFKENVPFNKKDYLEGDEINVQGIVSQYKEEYRILPRDISDIKKISANQENAGGSIINVAEASEINSTSIATSTNQNNLISKLIFTVSGLIILMIILIYKTKLYHQWFKKIKNVVGGGKNTKAKDGQSQYHE